MKIKNKIDNKLKCNAKKKKKRLKQNWITWDQVRKTIKFIGLEKWILGGYNTKTLFIISSIKILTKKKKNIKQKP